MQRPEQSSGWTVLFVIPWLLVFLTLVWSPGRSKRMVRRRVLATLSVVMAISSGFEEEFGRGNA